MPELFRFTNKKEHRRLLTERVTFFSSLLEYEPQNICILTPSKQACLVLIDCLREIQVEWD